MSLIIPPYPVIPGHRFKEIPGFFGYGASTDGRIWSCRWRPGRFSDSWHVLKTGDQHGYRFVKLFRDNKPHRCRVHTLILTLFVGPRPDGMLARHFPDPNTANNRLDNLQWGTAKENANDRRIHGTNNNGSRHGRAKLREADIPVIRRMVESNVSRRAIAKQYGVCITTIDSIVSGRLWRHVS